MGARPDRDISVLRHSSALRSGPRIEKRGKPRAHWPTRCDSRQREHEEVIARARTELRGQHPKGGGRDARAGAHGHVSR